MNIHVCTCEGERKEIFSINKDKKEAILSAYIYM